MSWISDGIEITPEQVTAAIGGALDALTLRVNADSDKLVIEAAKIVDLETGLTAQNSDLGSQINAVSNAQSSLVSRTEFDEGRITTLAEDVVALNSQVDITNSDGSLSNHRRYRVYIAWRDQCSRWSNHFSRNIVDEYS